MNRIARLMAVGSLTVLALLAPALAQGDSTLIDFRIRDQFETVHTEAEFAGRVVLLIGSARPGSEYNPVWGAAIRDSLLTLGIVDSVRLLSVADLRGVPFFMKGFVRGKIPKDPQTPILTDWDGTLARHYRFNPETSNIFVFNREGRLLDRWAVLQLDPAVVAEVVAVLTEAVGAPGRRGAGETGPRDSGNR